MHDRLGSLSHSTHSSSLHTSPVQRVRVLNILGPVEKVCFLSSILATEHLIVLVHDIFDGGLVRVLVDHYRYHVSEAVRVRINF